MSGRPIVDYRVGLVLARPGLNDVQLAFFRHHLKDLARLLPAPPRLVVPVVFPHGSKDGANKLRAHTKRLLTPLQDLMDWLQVELVEETDVAAVVRRMLAADEVWCATCKSTGSEYHTRPAHVHLAAQGHRNAARFKWLHYWMEPDPRWLPAQETKKGAPRPALKG